MDLKLLGLNDYEAKCYESVVKLGKSTAAQISKVSRVPYGRIYDILSSLEERGFVKVVPGKTKLYVPGDPQNLLDSLRRKRAKIDKLQDDLRDLKKIYELKEFEPVLVAQGKANFHKIIREREKAKEFEFSIRPRTDPRPEFLRREKEQMKKGLDIRSLVRHEKETKENVQKFLKINPKFREIENDGVAMGIIESSVFIGLINSNTTILIRDKAFIKLMKDLFLAKYKEAKEIPKE